MEVLLPVPSQSTIARIAKFAITFYVRLLDCRWMQACAMSIAAYTESGDSCMKASVMKETASTEYFYEGLRVR